MADVSIKYKGSAIAEMNDTGSKTCQTNGKYCEGDIVIEYTDPEKPTQSKTVTPTAAGFTVTPDNGKVLSSVVVNGDADLISDNVRSGANIFGVDGSPSVVDTSDATADASEIISGKTAYVNGSKINGVLDINPVKHYATGTFTGSSSRHATITHNLNSDKIIVFVQANDGASFSEEYIVIGGIWVADGLRTAAGLSSALYSVPYSTDGSTTLSFVQKMITNTVSNTFPANHASNRAYSTIAGTVVNNYTGADINEITIISQNEVKIDSRYRFDANVTYHWTVIAVTMAENARLPAEYQEVDYIQTDGNAYIDTGYAYSGNAEIEMEIYRPASSYARFFGAAENSGVDSFIVGTESNNDMKFIVTAKNATETFTLIIPYGSNINTGAWEHLKVKASNSSMGIIDIERTLGNISTESLGNSLSANCYFMADNYNGTARIVSGTRGKLLKIWDGSNNTLVRNLVSCYRKSDSVIGMYDLVNSQFYTNAGSGSFTKGPDVDTPENVYETLLTQTWGS